MKPHYADDDVTLYAGDCIEVMRGLPDNSVDAVVTDPPYGLEFMGKEWDKFSHTAPVLRSGWDHAGSHGIEDEPGDHPGAKSRVSFHRRRSTFSCTRCGKRDAFRNAQTCGEHSDHAWQHEWVDPAPIESHAFQAWCAEWATEALRVLKPGGHLAAFGGTRTWHRLACAIEDAGFEIRDSLTWMYGSGFPKSLDVSKAIDKQRDDREDVYRVTAWIRAARDAAGISNRDIDAAFGFAGMAGHWTSAKSQPAVPTLEQVPQLLDVLGVTLDEVPDDIRDLLWTLNGRKGQPGPNWAKREVVGVRTTGIGTGKGSTPYIGDSGNRDITAPATAAAQQWQGWGTALKPAYEPIVWARKPLTVVPLGYEVNHLHHLIGALLWLLLSPARRAELSSTSSQAEQHAETCVSVHVLAVTPTSPDESDVMDTCNSRATESTRLSIASSWSAILAALSDATRTFTTSTASSTTTALRILSSLLAPLTSQSTMPACECLVGGSQSNAKSAGQVSSAEYWSWLRTLSATAPASATEPIAQGVASVLASIAAQLSADQGAEPTAQPSATTRAAANSEGLSPAYEPIVLARKPLAGTVAGNVLAWRTGGLNIDGCRVGYASEADRAALAASVDGVRQRGGVRGNSWKNSSDLSGANPASTLGRWPANVILDETAAAMLDQQSGWSQSPPVGSVAVKEPRLNQSSKGDEAARVSPNGHGDSGGASRFFYTAKAGRDERPNVDGIAHPTVKPLDLMRWLVRLVTPPGGVVLEPFAGSGTTAEACVVEGFRCIAIEREADYLPLIVQRLSKPIERTLL